MARLISLLFTLGCLAFFAMVYDNVYTDLDPVRSLADAAACGVQNCKKHHGVTQIERTWSGQSFTYRWEDAVVNVDCKRHYFAVGPRECVAK